MLGNFTTLREKGMCSNLDILNNIHNTYNALQHFWVLQVREWCFEQLTV